MRITIEEPPHFPSQHGLRHSFFVLPAKAHILGTNERLGTTIRLVAFRR